MRSTKVHLRLWKMPHSVSIFQKWFRPQVLPSNMQRALVHMSVEKCLANITVVSHVPSWSLPVIFSNGATCSCHAFSLPNTSLQLIIRGRNINLNRPGYLVYTTAVLEMCWIVMLSRLQSAVLSSAKNPEFILIFNELTFCFCLWYCSNKSGPGILPTFTLRNLAVYTTDIPHKIH